jgi:transglutaminase-like putative cysteine protease
MRLKIRHETTYAYREPLRSAIQLLRLTPRSFDTQFVRRWRVTVDANARLDRGEDAYGNVTHLAFIDGPLETLRILVEGEIDTTPGDGIVRGSVERQSERLFLRDTPLTLLSPAIQDFARRARAAEGGNTLAGLHRINTMLNADMAFEVGTTTVATPAADAFQRKTGVCQDFAHIFIAAARALLLPARYVSGYYLRTDMTEQIAGHAWAEVYLPPMGWIAFDPANGVCATERHVRVAIGSDSNEAAPIRGARSGGEGEALRVSISVAQGRTVVEGPAQMQQQ